MNLNPKLNRRTGIILASIGLVAAALFWPREETPRQERNRLRREAEKAFHAEIANTVVGYHRTISTRDHLWDDQYSKWTAEAEVEFVNKQGGIERTNAHFSFYVNSDGEHNRLFCHYDFQRDIAAEKERERVAAALAKRLPGETPQQFQERLRRAIAGQ